MDFSREIMKVAKNLQASGDLSKYIKFDTKTFIKDIADEIKNELSNINNKYDAKLYFRAILDNFASIENKNDGLFICNFSIRFDDFTAYLEYNVGSFSDTISSTPSLPISEIDMAKRILFAIKSYLTREKVRQRREEKLL